MDEEHKQKIKREMKESSVEDGEHTILKCSSCAAPLVDIWITKPEASVKFKMSAKCCFCEDKSFSKIITGIFHLGATNKTSIAHCESIDQDEDVLEGNVDLCYLIHTQKNTTSGRKKGKQRDGHI